MASGNRAPSSVPTASQLRTIGGLLDRCASQQGFLDSVKDGVLSGWALDKHSKSPVILEVAIDDVPIAEITCSDFRSDVAKATHTHGFHGFQYVLPKKYWQHSGILTVRFANGLVLNNGKLPLSPFDTTFLVGTPPLISSVLAKGLWCVDRLEVSPSRIFIDGWSIPPRAISVPTAIAHNGVALQDIRRVPRHDIAGLLDAEQDTTQFGFQAYTPVLPGCEQHDFSFEHAYTRQPFDSNQTVHYLPSDEVLPPEHLRVRVHGSADAASFVKEGSTAYVQFGTYLKRYFWNSFEDFSRILDWGCGCGRMLRYFPDSARAKLVGIDIDAEAIEWCRQAFAASEFMTVKPEPPVAIANETFDLIYANSVMTHLSERTHVEWLLELRRLAKPNAIVLLTTLGDVGCWKARFSGRLFSDWRIHGSGFFDVGRNPDLDSLGIDEYYRNTFISHDYIANNWSRYFDIIDFIPTAVGGIQDLTILRRRD